MGPPRPALAAALLLAAAATAPACATLRASPERLAAVRTVAVIGWTAAFDLDAPAGPGGPGLEAARSAHAVRRLGDLRSGAPDARRLARGLATYELFTEALRERLGWVVLTREQIVADPAYRRLYVARVADAWGGEGVARLGGLMVVPDLLWEDRARGLDEAELAALRRALGVDAVVVARLDVRFRVEGFTAALAGTLALRPQASLSVELLDGRGADPAWRDVAARGAPSRGALDAWAGAFRDDDVTPLVLEAAASACERLVERLRAASSAR